MKVLIVAPLYPPYARGGGGAVISAIAENLVKRGHDLTVISGYFSKKPLTALPHRDWSEGIEIIWIPLMSIMEKARPQLRGSLPPNIPSIAFLKTIDYDSYDVIHLSAFGHLLIDFVNLFAKNPSKILTIHAFPKYFEKEGKANAVFKFLYRIYFRTLGNHTLQSAKAITAVSKFTLGECIKLGLPKDRIKLIENGIDLDNFAPLKYGEFEERYHVEKKDIVILSISRVTWHKGYEYALEAIHRVVKATGKPIKYVIVGAIEDQDYRLKLEKQIRALSLQDSVRFTGFLSNSMKMQALSRSNIFLAPSVHEGFGLVLLEAMASGKPIIASNCEGFQNILENMITGLLVEPANVEEIATAMMRLLFNSGLQERLSKNALYSVKKYAWVERVEEYQELYKQVK